MGKLKTIGATTLAATAIMGASLMGAAPAQAASVSTYAVVSSTLSGCQNAVNGDVRDLKAQRIYKTHTACARNWQGYYISQIWYYSS